MQPILEAAIGRICEHQDLPAEAMEEITNLLMSGACSPMEIAALLVGLRVKGEAISEIVGAARSMQQHATTIPTTRTGLVDTCGTGGDHLHTFNISTATALVLAAAGIPVAKHGNRSVSSSSGSADVLEALGVNLQLTPEQVGLCLDEVGLGFCFAPLLHGAMKHVAPIRRELKVRTIFNLLGPLTNPARASRQLLGANKPATAEKLARALADLGRERAFVVCGNGELDEVSLWGETLVYEVRGNSVIHHTWSAETFGLPVCQASDFQVSSPRASAEIIQGILAGKEGPARDIVVANTAAGLLLAESCTNHREAVALAQLTIDRGAARDLLAKLVEFTQARK